jgi:hypothetical protein
MQEECNLASSGEDCYRHYGLKAQWPSPCLPPSGLDVVKAFTSQPLSDILAGPSSASASWTGGKSHCVGSNPEAETAENSDAGATDNLSDKFPISGLIFHCMFYICSLRDNGGENSIEDVA